MERLKQDSTDDLTKEENEDEVAQFNKMLKDLNLPLEICDILAGMPEQIRHYIMDEILEEAKQRKIVVAEKTGDK